MVTAAAETQAKTEPVAEKKAIAKKPLSEFVLVVFDASVRPDGEITQAVQNASFFAPKKGTKKEELKTVQIFPGVQKMKRSTWEIWVRLSKEPNQPTVQFLFEAGAIRLVSDEGIKLAPLKGYDALKTIKMTSDPDLLQAWAEEYEDLSEAKKQALFDRQSELEITGRPSTRNLFGKQVPA